MVSVVCVCKEHDVDDEHNDPRYKRQGCMNWGYLLNCLTLAVKRNKEFPVDSQSMTPL